MDAAEVLAQRRGFHGFSFRDIGACVGVTTASVHHYFPSKDDLSTALVDRFKNRFQVDLNRLRESSPDSREQLSAYCALYQRTFSSSGQFCLMAMLSTDLSAISPQAQYGVQNFFSENEVFLSKLLARGKREGVLQFQGAAGPVAKMILSALEGGMVLCRGLQSTDYNRITQALLAQFVR